MGNTPCLSPVTIPITLFKDTLGEIARKLCLTISLAPSNANMVWLPRRASNLFPRVRCTEQTSRGRNTPTATQESIDMTTSGRKRVHLLASLVTRKILASGVRTILDTTFVTFNKVKPPLDRHTAKGKQPDVRVNMNLVTYFKHKSGVNTLL